MRRWSPALRQCRSRPGAPTGSGANGTPDTMCWLRPAHQWTPHLSRPDVTVTRPTGLAVSRVNHQTSPAGSHCLGGRRRSAPAVRPGRRGHPIPESNEARPMRPRAGGRLRASWPDLPSRPTRASQSRDGRWAGPASACNTLGTTRDCWFRGPPERRGPNRHGTLGASAHPSGNAVLKVESPFA